VCLCNHCCHRRETVRYLFIVSVYVAANNIYIFSVATEIQQWISLALFSTYRIFVLQLTTISFKYYVWLYSCLSGPGSVLGIATGYGLVGLGIESRWGRDFPHLSRQALGPTQPPIQWVPGLLRGKERPGHEADPSLPSSAVVKKE